MIFDHLMAHPVAFRAMLAQAAPAGGGAPGGLLGNPLTMLLPMMVILYFIMIRPQRQKQKQAEDMQKALAAGDEIVTIGGAHGVITTVREKTVVVRMAEGKIEFDRSAIATRLSKSEAPLVSGEVVADSK
jgi:preprotein translocase subunit YajC